MQIITILAALIAGCAGDQIQYNAGGKNPVYSKEAKQADEGRVPYAMPREGWATDPHLSYALFSYYPVNHGNTGMYFGHYGYANIYYH